ncbi:uncharacterized protein [Malus domestica]|uniref:uncharacterized protein isoform X3 n=1 Tax=Malus domestica TaxID=3750 RepID=UPI0039748447
MIEKYCPITAEHELSIVSIIHGEKIWAIRAQCKASCKYGKKPRHSSTQESLGSCPSPIQEFGDDGFMIWMVGSIVHLFSIGITFSALWQPISTLHGVGKGLCVQQEKSFHSYELLGPLLPSQQRTYLGLHSPFTIQPCNTKIQEKQRLEVVGFGHGDRNYRSVGVGSGCKEGGEGFEGRD